MQLLRFYANFWHHMSADSLNLHGFMSSQVCKMHDFRLEGHPTHHGLRTPNEGINQRYLKSWADVADKICFGRT